MNDNYWKSIPKQTLFGFGDTGEIGDCWRCCVAAILHRPANTVPHFVKNAIETNRDIDALTQQWLSAQGYWLVTLYGTSPYSYLSPPAQVISYQDDEKPPFPVICNGPTIRSQKSDQAHSVIMNGDQLLYDPHPSEAGLLAVTSSHLIVKYY